MKPILLLFLTAAALHAQVPRVLNFQGRVTSGGVNFTGNGRFKFALIDAGTNVNQTATASAVIYGGTLTSINITTGGSGYTVPPQVTILGDGSDAAATATISGGALTGITVTKPGSGYTAATVSITAPPPSMVYQTWWSNDGTSTGGSEPAANVPTPVIAGLYSVALGGSGMSPLPASVFEQNSGVQLRVWFDDGVHGSQLLLPDQPIRAVAYALMAAGVEDHSISSSKLKNGAVLSGHIAPGSVTSAHLYPGAVQALHIATGAVGHDQLASGAVGAENVAPGSITSTHLARPPRLGVLTPQTPGVQNDFGQVWFDVPFVPAFNSIPVITLSIASANSSLGRTTPWIRERSPGHFTCSVSAPPPAPVPFGVPPSGVRCATTEIAAGAGASCGAAADGGLRFVRWGGDFFTGILDATPGAGQFSSLKVIGARPCIAYTSGGDTLKFIRATNAEGTAWGPPVTVGAAVQSRPVALVGVPGSILGTENPAIAFVSPAGNTLCFVTAANAGGTLWNAPVTVTDGCWHLSANTVGGKPAVCYLREGQTSLRYQLALDNQGAAWGAGTVLAAQGGEMSLGIANGVPVVGFAHISGMRFVRALDAAGSAWQPVQQISSSGGVRGVSMTVASGRPMLAWCDITRNAVHYCRALDAAGAAWPADVIVAENTVSTVSARPAVVTQSGSPTVIWQDMHSGELRYSSEGYASVPDFSLNWMAMEP